MESNNSTNLDQEFDLLGQKIKFKAGGDKNISAERVVNLVKSEAEKISANRDDLDNGQIAILVALKMASDKLAIEGDYRKNVEELHHTAMDALNILDEVAPRQ